MLILIIICARIYVLHFTNSNNYQKFISLNSKNENDFAAPKVANKKEGIH